MPIYEYKCEKCGIFEVTQRITENPLKRCPTCSGKVERIISHTSFILKGSGWYATDYGHSGSGGTSKGDSPSESTNGASTSSTASSGSSDSKSSADKGTSKTTD